MTAFLFDLDGTLVDSVYQHVDAWHAALAEAGCDLAQWRIHRKIGMSGSLLMRALSLELGRDVDAAFAERLSTLHRSAFERRRDSITAFPGARELLRELRAAGVPFAICSSGDARDQGPSLALLDLPANVPVVCKQDAPRAKPDPGLFLAGAKALGVDPAETVIVGDAVWDMLAARRAHGLGVGVLSGGYSESELTDAGAYRVYADVEALRRRLHETGVEL